MFKKRFILQIILVTILEGVYTVDIPEYMKVCSRNDPHIEDCVKGTVNAMKPYLKNGIKELNVPAMEPLYLGDFTLLEAASAGITVKVKKLNIYGASNFDIKKIRASENAKRFDFEISLPRLEGEGSYDINGQILALPIKGNGPFTGNFTNFYAYVTVNFEVNTVNDVDTITVREMKVRIRTGKGRLKLENLFGGDKALGDVINDTINQNFELFTNEVIAPLERALEKKFTAISRKILENFTYNELFPV